MPAKHRGVGKQQVRPQSQGDLKSTFGRSPSNFVNSGSTAKVATLQVEPLACNNVFAQCSWQLCSMCQYLHYESFSGKMCLVVCSVICASLASHMDVSQAAIHVFNRSLCLKLSIILCVLEHRRTERLCLHGRGQSAGVAATACHSMISAQLLRWRPIR